MILWLHRYLFWLCFMNKVHYLFQLMFLPYRHQFFIMSWSRRAVHPFPSHKFYSEPWNRLYCYTSFEWTTCCGFYDAHSIWNNAAHLFFGYVCLQSAQLPSSRNATSNECLQAGFHIQTFLVTEKETFWTLLFSKLSSPSDLRKQ